jgi:hypothetical protein
VTPSNFDILPRPPVSFSANCAWVRPYRARNFFIRFLMTGT